MFLEHVNLVVSDLTKSLSFYKAAFPHWTIRSKGNGEWYGKSRIWIHFGDSYHYIAMSDHGEGTNRRLSGHQVGLAHFAYVVNDIESLISRMRKAGFEVEFVQYLSDLPHERNSD